MVKRAELDEQLGVVARILKIRRGDPNYTQAGSKYPCKDSCIFISGAYNRLHIQIFNREGHVWSSPLLTPKEMSEYITALYHGYKLLEMKKRRDF